jgi:hypothetical protein
MATPGLTSNIAKQIKVHEEIYPHVRIISYTDIEVWTVFLREPSTS